MSTRELLTERAATLRAGVRIVFEFLIAQVAGLATAAVPLLVMAWLRGSGEGLPSDENVVPFSVIGFDLALIVIWWWRARRGEAPTWRRLMPRSWLRTLALGAAYGLLCVAAGQAVSWLQTAVGLPEVDQGLSRLVAEAGGVELLLLAAAVTLAAPLAEELFFRAYLFRAFAPLAPSALLTSSAVLFAAIHLQPTAFLPLVAIGLLLGLGYRHGGDVVVPIVAHAVNNGAGLVLLIVERGGL